MEKILNENDYKLLAFCKNKDKSVGEIAEFLKIHPKNVSVRVEKLKKDGLVFVEKRGIGKKTLVRTSSGIKTDQYVYQILSFIKEHKGDVSKKEFLQILDYDVFNQEETHVADKISARWEVQGRGFIEPRMKLTSSGEEELKKLSKKFSKN